MRARQPYWQNYWYVVRFRREGAPLFTPMGPGGPDQVPNKWLATGSVEEFVDWFLGEAVDDLDDLRGELRVLVYTEATPGRTPSRCWCARPNSGAGLTDPPDRGGDP